MRINKHDTNGTKPLLGKGELGYDDYVAGGDVGRVYVGTGSENIALAERLESNMMTKAQFNALAEERKANRAGSGFDEWGKHAIPSSTTLVINEGMWVTNVDSNIIVIGRSRTYGNVGLSKSYFPIVNINGYTHKLASNLDQTIISLPTAPNIYPHDTVLTAEQIASGVIKHADSSNSGLITLGKNLSGTTFNRTVVVVNGKKYIIEYKDSGVRKTLEITASSTSYIVSLSGTNITEVGMYPADAISRSDLVFLESWHEDISEKNFAYPLGNVQYLGGNTDGLTGITNGNFTGFETYSLFGNWQTPSGLIGKGYIWSSLTEAQKKAFISNPENNCYLDGDKTIQVRYRVRVAMGLGDNWDYPVAIIDGGGSGPAGSTISYSAGTGNKYLKPKGKKVNILNDVTAYNANDTGFFANKNYKTIPTSYESGMATAIATNNTTLDTGVAYEGKCFALPIALVHRRNQGMYHPVYNANGTKKASDGNFWYNTAVSFTSISDCFDPSKLLTASGYIGSVSGRPDGLFYDQVHEGDITDLRNSSKKVEDYNRLIGREFNKLVDGTYRGKEAETQIIAIRTFTKSSTFGINGNRFYFGITGTSYPEIALAPEYNLEFTLVGSNGSVYNTRQVLNIPNVVTMYIPLAGNTQVYIPIDGKNTAGTMNTLFPDGTTITVIVAKRTTRTKSNTLLHCDIIGNPANYPASWKESGVFGTPLVATEDGTSLLPDGVRDTFKLSRKANATPLVCLRSTDSGVTWTSFTPTFTSLTNEITLTNEPAANLVMVYYQTHTSMAVPVVNSEVLEMGDVIGTNGLVNGALISTLIGKVPTANTAPYLQMGYDINGYRIDMSTLKFSTTATEIPLHSALSLAGGAVGVPAVKVFPYLTRANGKAFLNLVFKEMKHNGTSWGDSNKFEIVDNVSTTTDNNAQTVLIGQKTVELPYFIGADE